MEVNSSQYDGMKTVAEIEAALPEMPTAELHHLEVTIHGIYRERHERVIYDDGYGVWLEDDQTSAAAEVCSLLDTQLAPEQIGTVEAVVKKWLGLGH
jgi:hypothetical protein